MERDPDQYDLFVSYCRKDNQNGWISGFVDQVLHAHHELGTDRSLVPFFDKNEISSFDNWEDTIESALARSRLFMAFLSPSYLASTWCRREWLAWTHYEISKHILGNGTAVIYIVDVPELEDPCVQDDQFAEATTSILSQICRRQFTKLQQFYRQGIESFGGSELQRVITELARDLDERVQLVRRAASSASTVPQYNEQFTGRRKELAQLRDLLQDQRSGVICGIHGLGGVGKSELAFTYAHANAYMYPGGRFQIRCEGQSRLCDAILQAHDFTWYFRDEISADERKNSSSHFAAILHALRQRIDRLGPVLLVLDNVTDAALVSFEQTDTLTWIGPQLHLLATTRLPPPTIGRWLQLSELTEGDAMSLLDKHRPFDEWPSDARYTTDEERDAALLIVRKLGGFTLAVELLAAWMETHSDRCYSDFAATLNLVDLQIMADSDESALRRCHHERGLSAVLQPVLDDLTPEERRTLEYAATMHPDLIGLPWLKALVAVDFPHLLDGGRLADPWEDLCRRLERRSLICRVDEKTWKKQIVRVHRLVLGFVIQQLPDAETGDRCTQTTRMVLSQTNELQLQIDRNEIHWQAQSLAGIALVWAEYKHPDAARLLNRAGAIFFRLGEWAAAEFLLSGAFCIEDEAHGDSTLQMASILNNLAMLFSETDRLEQAGAHCRFSLSIIEAARGPVVESIAMHCTLVRILHQQGLYDEAVETGRRAVALLEANTEGENSQACIAVGNLALALQSAGLYAEAETLELRAIEMAKRVFGPNHHEVATAVNNLAVLYRNLARYDEAEALIREAIEICEESVGPLHHSTAKSLNNLGLFLLERHHLEEADHVLGRALEIYLHVHGENHSDVRATLNNKAVLSMQSGRWQEAEYELQRLISICDPQGNDHPDFALVLQNLAVCRLVQHRLEGVENLLLRSMSIYEKLYEGAHPDLGKALLNLASYYQKVNQLGNAEQKVRRALEVFEVLVDEDHPHMLLSLSTLGDILRCDGRSAEAEPILRRAIQAYRRLDQKDENLALALNNLALVLQERNGWAEAEELNHQALAVNEAIFGSGHIAVALNCSNLSELYRVTNRLSEAELFCRRSLEIYVSSFGEIHPDVAAELAGLGRLLFDMQRAAEAEPLARRALEIYQQLDGDQSLAIAGTIGLIGRILHQVNRNDDAIQFLRLSFALAEDTKSELTIAVSANNLARFLCEQGELPEAETLARRALDLMESITGPQSPDVAAVLVVLANVLRAAGELPEASASIDRAGKILLQFKAVSGYDHVHWPGVDKSLQSFAARGNI